MGRLLAKYLECLREAERNGVPYEGISGRILQESNPALREELAEEMYIVRRLFELRREVFDNQHGDSVGPESEQEEWPPSA